MNNIDINKIKLVIWDLDDTFWQGTISEGAISLSEKNNALVKLLTDCGIVNSICSKNDYDVAKKALEDAALWDYFVCPSINWESKGNRVKTQISDLQLRDSNVLFIDDNISNLNEVRFYNKNIMIAGPEIIDEFYEQATRLPKTDLHHKRLDRYKIIEKKLEKKAQSESNTAFLYDCNIKATIHENCKDEIERLHELLLRTNQLNYTKIRPTIDELTDDINNEEYHCGYVTVTDDYGDYGIIGFYCLTPEKLKHFAFSCRCLGMGIEQYVYSKLEYPELTVEGDIAIPLVKGECPPWINVSTGETKKEKGEINDAIKVLLKGPCDMSQIFSFIKENDNIECEFTYPSETGVSIEQRNHTQCILQSLTLDPERKEQIIQELPFGDKDMYTQYMFEKKYNIVFLSTLNDCGLGVYRRKTGEYVAFGEYIHPLTDEKEWDGYINNKTPSSNCTFTLEDLKLIKENYEYMGRMTTDNIIENIKKILNMLDKKTYLILLLGSETPYEVNLNHAYDDRHLFHKELNDKVKKLAASEERIKYIEFSKYIKSQNDFYNNVNHFMKHVYFGVSKEMLSFIVELMGLKISNNKKEFIKQFSKQFIKKLLRQNKQRV